MTEQYFQKMRERKKIQWFSNRAGKNGRILFCILLVFLFFVVPVLRLFWMSFSQDHTFTFQNYIDILTEHFTWRIVGNTIGIVFGATTLSVMLGVAFAWVTTYTNIRWKRALQVFIFIPFIIPSYIVTIAWTQLAANMPFDINFYSYSGMIFVLGISHFPLVYLFTVNVLRRIPKELEQAVHSSGGSQSTAFFKVTFPLALPGIVGGGILAFLSNLDNFGIPAFLGIPANITVLSTAIYQEVISFGPVAFSRAATLSVLLVVLAFIGISLQWKLLRKTNLDDSPNFDDKPRVLLRKSKEWVEMIVWIVVLSISVVPLVSMLKTSVIRAYGLPFNVENFTFKHYRYLLFEYDKAFQSITISLQLALLTTCICIIVGTMIAYYRMRKGTIAMRFVEGMVSVPYALPGMVLALAMIFAWMEPIPGWNPGIYGTVWILCIAYITRFLILQVRGSMSTMAQVSVELEEAAQVSGANVFVKWKSILLPLFLPGILSGAFLVLLTTLTELTVSSLLWSSGTETIGIVIFNFQQAGYTTYSSAFSVIVLCMMLLLASIVFGFQLFWKWRFQNK